MWTDDSPSNKSEGSYPAPTFTTKGFLGGVLTPVQGGFARPADSLSVPATQPAGPKAGGRQCDKWASVK